MAGSFEQTTGAAPGLSTQRTTIHPWLVVLALAPGIFLTLADATVMSVAVPLIIRRLEGSVISVSWVMNGYNLVLTVLFLTMGRLADRYGHKLLFVLGLALFTAASVGCALAGTVDALIAWRVVQAVGAAAVVPTALALLLQAFPDERQGFAAGLFGALSSAAAAAGPVLGGVLIQRWGWPAVFWFNVPVGALGVILPLALVRRSRASTPAAAAAPPAPASRSTGPASASSAPGCSASRWRSSRATTGAGPPASSSASSPRRPRSWPSGSGGSCAPPPRSSTCGCSGGARSPARAPPS